MLRILNEEGFDIKERELMRVRAKNRWLLRVPNGMKTRSSNIPDPNQLDDEDLLALHQETYKEEEGFANPGVQETSTESRLQHETSDLSPEILEKRRERLEQLKAESAERWAARRRRRRTRGWAGLPPDPPGPPRFPSETTIDESKQYLNLDSEMYRALRDQFQRICQDSGFIKKTVAGPEKWQEAKDRLIQESPHLQTVFWAYSTQLEAKTLALDVVCTDVTKRMRTLERRMTIAEAKNALGINPEQSRQIRNAFYNTLKADHFTSKLEAGDEHWKELKDQWIQGSELLQNILAPGMADPDHEMKVRAVEVLCRDVMKRLRDDQTKRDPTRKRSASSNNDNGTRRTSTRTNNKQTNNNDGNNGDNVNNSNNGIRNGISALASRALASAPMMPGDIPDLQIDPSLLQAANDPSFIDPHNRDSQSFGYVDPMLDAALIPTPVYLRVHPQSQVYQNAKTWLDKLSTRSVIELKHLVTAKFKHDVHVARIEGTEKDENGREVSYLIDEDHELDAYLTHVQGRKATFVFLLQSQQ